jgi:hypothetical protein
MQINLPTNSDRTVAVGRTGTGKTVAGLWHLSNYDLTKPWVIFNFKDDEHINSLENTLEVDVGYVPTKKDQGIFVVNPSPYDLEGSSLERSKVDKYLLKLWERRNIGIFIDEAFVLGNSKALIQCLTQGRSLRIPMILCTQRPVWITRFAFSEASFIQVFDLNDDRDKDTVEGFVPIEDDDFDALEKYESYYYDIAENHLVKLLPVPNMDKIREIFVAKLPTRRIHL